MWLSIDRPTSLLDHSSRCLHDLRPQTRGAELWPVTGTPAVALHHECVHRTGACTMRKLLCNKDLFQASTRLQAKGL